MNKHIIKGRLDLNNAMHIKLKWYDVFANQTLWNIMDLDFMSQGTPRNNSKLHRFCGKLETNAKERAPIFCRHAITIKQTMK